MTPDEADEADALLMKSMAELVDRLDDVMRGGDGGVRREVSAILIVYPMDPNEGDASYVATKGATTEEVLSVMRGMVARLIAEVARERAEGAS